MNEIELKNSAIRWLSKFAKEHISRPQKVTPKELAEAVGGAYTSVGKIAESITAELLAQGCCVSYERSGNRRYFLIQ